MAEKLVKITCLWGYSNNNRFGRTNVGDPRIAFYLPETENYRDGVFFVRLKAKDRRMKWYEDSPNDPQVNDVRAYMNKENHHVLEKICEISALEREIDEFKKIELKMNELRKNADISIQKYFSEIIERTKRTVVLT
jgi:hypothetical protein